MWIEKHTGENKLDSNRLSEDKVQTRETDSSLIFPPEMYMGALLSHK